MKSTPALRLDIRHSRIELVGLAALHLLMLPMPWLAALPVVWRAAICAGLLASACYEWRKWYQAPPTLLRLLPDGAWAVSIHGEAEIEATLLPGAFCHRLLVVLPLQIVDQRKRRLVLWPDSAQADELRTLRSWLRWGATFEVDGPVEEASTT